MAAGLWHGLMLFASCLSILSNVVGQATTQLCQIATTCDSCIRLHPDCAWCGDPGALIRCQVHRLLVGSCNSTIHPRSNSSTMSVDLTTGGTKNIHLDLRSGESVTFDVTVERGQFPVDIYFLMDISNSMTFLFDFLPSAGPQVVKSIKEQLTPDVRLGLGSFSDKTVQPYWRTNRDGTFFQVATVGGQATCGFSTVNTQQSFECGEPVGYRHLVDLQANTTRFTEVAAQQLPVLANQGDPSRSSFDALFQAAICEEVIGWSTYTPGSSIRIIIVATDEPFHSAGDGIMAGLLNQIEGEACDLDSEGRYRSERTRDFPSIGQLKSALENHQITVVAASTLNTVLQSNPIEYYQRLSSELGELVLVAPFGRSADSLIGTSVNQTRLASEQATLLLRNGPNSNNQLEGVEFRAVANCPVNDASGIINSTEVQGCRNMVRDQRATFSVTLTGRNCSSLRQTSNLLLYINPGYGILNITINPICDCSCTSMPNQNTGTCNGGNLTCGQCVCPPDRMGQQCQCETADLINKTSPAKDCRPPDATLVTQVCTGNGQCSVNSLCVYSCGRCSQGFHGTYCQCNDNNCPLENGQPCGGELRGTCRCSIENSASCGGCECTCNQGFERNPETRSCCPISNDGCSATATSQVCSGNGRCRCRKCECQGGWEGAFCDTCFEGNCPTICDRALPCLNAPAACNGTTCCNCNGQVMPMVNEACQTGCTQISCNGQMALTATVSGGTYSAQISAENNRSVEHTPCPVTRGSCTTTYYVAVNPVTNEFLPIAQDPTEVCSSSFDYLPVVLGIVFGLVGVAILVLVIFKIVIHILDEREYRRFLKAQKGEKWDQGGNPLFKKATTTVQNPTYKGQS